MKENKSYPTEMTGLPQSEKKDSETSISNKDANLSMRDELESMLENTENVPQLCDPREQGINCEDCGDLTNPGPCMSCGAENKAIQYSPEKLRSEIIALYIRRKLEKEVLKEADSKMNNDQLREFFSQISDIFPLAQSNKSYVRMDDSMFSFIRHIRQKKREDELDLLISDENNLPKLNSRIREREERLKILEEFMEKVEKHNESLRD